MKHRIDPDTHVLEGYRLSREGRDYVPIEPNERGDLPVGPLGLALGVRQTKYRLWDEPFVRWIDERGEPLPIGAERAERATAEAQKATAEAKRPNFEAEQQRVRAEEALTRVRELEARVGRQSE